MTVNSKKTKEMVLGPLSKESTTPLLMTGNLVQQVTQYKLLGVTINDAALKCDDHLNASTSKAEKRLWFLKKLKQRAGIVKEDLACFFQTVVRPIVKYACHVWHTMQSHERTVELARECQSSAVLSRSLSATRGVDPYGTGGHSPNIYEVGTSMVMSPQYFRSDVV